MVNARCPCSFQDIVSRSNKYDFWVPFNTIHNSPEYIWSRISFHKDYMSMIHGCLLLDCVVTDRFLTDSWLTPLRLQDLCKGLIITVTRILTCGVLWTAVTLGFILLLLLAGVLLWPAPE